MTTSLIPLRRVVYAFVIACLCVVLVIPATAVSAGELPVWSRSDSGEVITTTAVAVAAAPAGGAWTVDAAGVVENYGGVYHLGDLNGLDLNAPIVDIDVTASGQGYLLVAADGGVFAFGDAEFSGSAADLDLAAPVVGISIQADGYWLAAADGGVFAYGTIPFYGSAGALNLAAPIVDIDANDADGYRLVGIDGGVFGFGEVEFYGSLGADLGGAEVVGIASHEGGYWLAATDGTMTGFGTANTESLGLEEGQASLVDVGSTPEGDYVAIFGELSPATEGEVFVRGLSTSRLAIWDALAECESTGDWAINTGNGFYGGIQFSPRSWRAVGGEGYPHQATRVEQIYRGELLKEIQGWGAWPGCTRKLGLR